MKTTDRIDLGREMCERLVGAIANISSDRLGAWPGAWEIVGPPSADFMELLTRWEDSGDTDLLPRLRTAYNDVLHAWQIAEREVRR